VKQAENINSLAKRDATCFKAKGQVYRPFALFQNAGRKRRQVRNVVCDTISKEFAERETGKSEIEKKSVQKSQKEKPGARRRLTVSYPQQAMCAKGLLYRTTYSRRSCLWWTRKTV
jgi:hypothetical protein